MTSLTARAEMRTDAPARYAKQLLSHLGRRVTWTTDGTTSTAELAGGTGRVVVGEGMLTLIAEAGDAEALGLVQHVLGSHLERFAQREQLQVRWVSDVTGSAGSTPQMPAVHRRPTLRARPLRAARNLHTYSGRDRRQVGSLRGWFRPGIHGLRVRAS